MCVGVQEGLHVVCPNAMQMCLCVHMWQCLMTMTEVICVGVFPYGFVCLLVIAVCLVTNFLYLSLPLLFMFRGVSRVPLGFSPLPPAELL